MTDLVSLPFIAMIPINCKITNFSFHLYQYSSFDIILDAVLLSSTIQYCIDLLNLTTI